MISLNRTADRSRNRLKRCEPLWTANGLTPRTACPHGHLIHEQDYCPVCSRCGQDGHPELQRSPLSDPKPEPKVPESKAKPLTRKERRRLLHAIKRAESPKWRRTVA